MCGTMENKWVKVGNGNKKKTLLNSEIFMCCGLA